MHVEERILRLRDGASVHCRCWTPPEGGTPSEAFLLLHGVESHGGWFEELAPELVKHGYAVFAPDRPGWGNSPGIRGHLEDYDQAVAFVEDVTGQIRTQHPRLHLAGLSWGGKLALYVAVRRPFIARSVSLIAPGLAMRKPFSLRARAQVAGGVLLGTGRNPVRLPMKPQDFTSRPDRRDFIRTDPVRVQVVTASFCLESHKMDRFLEEHIGRLRLPTQMLLAGEDAIVDNGAAEALFEKAGAQRTRTLRFDGAAHSLVFEAPAECGKALAAWAGEGERAHPSPKRVLVMGAGAVGSVLGGLLAIGGHEVTLVARERHAGAIRAAGLHLVVGETETRILERVRALTEPAGADGPFDLVILAVKGYDTEAALAALAPVLQSGVPILSVQNGVANEAVIETAAPDQPLLGGAVCGFFSMPEPGGAALADDRGGVALGPWRSEAADAAKAAAALLADTGLEVLALADARRAKWSKLMLNAAFNALNALTGRPTGALFAHPRLGRATVALLRECAQAMRAEGVEPADLPGYPVAKLARVVQFPTGVARRILAAVTARSTAGASSMARDLAAGKAQTEIDQINGAVSATGRGHGVETPVNDALCAVLREASGNDERLEAFRRDPAQLAEALGY
jgi:2-dehydropantoate 2-reductase